MITPTIEQKKETAYGMGYAYAEIQVINGGVRADSFLFEDIAPFDRLTLFNALEGRGWDDSDEHLDDDYAGEWLHGYDQRWDMECQSCQ